MSRQRTRFALITILLLAFGLRAYLLDWQELRGDEVFGYFFSLRGWGEMIRATVELQEPHPVAGYYVEKLWLGLAGRSEFALRYTSLWFSVLAVALTVRLGRRLALPATAAAAAALLLAVSPYAVWHAQDARMYSMSMALTVASTWLAVAWLADRRLAGAAGYVLVSWLALQTHYFAAFVMVAHYLYVMTLAIRAGEWRRTALPWLLIQGTVLVLYLPWLFLAGETLAGYGGNGDSPNFMAMLERGLAVFAMGESIPASQRSGVALLAAVLVIMGASRMITAGREARRSLYLLLLYMGTPLLATWLSSLQRPIFDERYLVAALPPFCLLVGAALAPIPRRNRDDESARQGYPPLRYTAVVLFGMLIVGMAASLNRHYHDPAYSKTRGWRELAAVLDRYTADLPADAARIAQNFPDPTLWYYYQGPVAHVVLPPAPHHEDGAAAAVDEMADQGVRRVLLPVQPAPNWDAQGIAAAALAHRYERVLQEQVGVWPLEVYAGAPGSEPGTPLDVVFENGIRLAGATGVADAALVPGGLITVALTWDAPADTPLAVTVQVLGPDGALVAQQDRPLAESRAVGGDRRRSQYGILVPDGLAPGTYSLLVALYDPTQEGAPRLLTAAGADAAPLATLSVAP